MVQVLAFYVAIPVLLLGIALSLVRVLRGPSLPDRVVAFDLIGAIAIGIIAAYVLATGEVAFLDVAIVIGLVSFLGTVAFARYIERSI